MRAPSRVEAVGDRDERRRIVLALCAVVLVLTAARLWLAARLGLAPDEAYYWSWSRDLAPVYPDHPPLVAWAIAFGARLADGEIGVRLPAILCGAGAIPLAYLAARAVGLSRRRSLLAAVAAALLPISSAGALVVTPDSLLGIAWLTGGLALLRLASGKDPRHWIALGLAAGLGLWAKHSALLLPVAAAVSCGVVPKLRASVGSRPFRLGLAAFALAALPYLAAEIAAGAPSWAYQIDHLRGALPGGTGGGTGAIPGRLGELVGGQVGLLTPIVAILFALALGRPCRDNPALRVALVLALVPVAAATLAALGTHPEQNWASLGHPFAAIAAVAAAEARFRGRTKAIWLGTTVAVVAAASIVIHAHALAPFLPLPPERDPVSRLHGWKDLAAIIDGPFDADLGGAPDAVACDNYGLAAELAWATRDKRSFPPIGSLDRPGRLPPGRWLLLDGSDDHGDRGVGAAPCVPIRKIGVFDLRREDGETVRRVDISVGEGCRSGPTARRSPVDNAAR